MDSLEDINPSNTVVAADTMKLINHDLQHPVLE